MSEIDLLIVDDQELVRTGMAMVLGSAPGLRVVGEAGDGATAYAACASCARTSCSWTCGCPASTA